MNSIAASGCSLSSVTAKVEPPCVPVEGAAVSHWGMGAIRHWPFCPGRAFIWAPASQAPVSRVRTSPLPICASDCLLSTAFTKTSSRSISPCQYSATRREGASARETFQAPLEVSNHWAPACQA